MCTSGSDPADLEPLLQRSNCQSCGRAQQPHPHCCCSQATASSIMQQRKPTNMWLERWPTDLELLYQGLHSQPDVSRPSSLVPTAAAARAPWWRLVTPSGGLCCPGSCHTVPLQVHQLALQVVCTAPVLRHILQAVLL